MPKYAVYRRAKKSPRLASGAVSEYEIKFVNLVNVEKVPLYIKNKDGDYELDMIMSTITIDPSSQLSKDFLEGEDGTQNDY